MKIAVAGRKGRLGSWLVEEAGCLPLRCDVTSPESIQQALDKVEPNVVINCAAWTNVDGAEDPEVYDDVIAVNLRGPANLRKAFKGLLVHISTGFVLPGTEGPHDEFVLPEPLNIYSWSKLGGEIAAGVRGPTITVRTLDLYSPKQSEHPDFVRQIRDLLELEVPKELPSNLFGNPTYIPHLSEALIWIANGWGTGVSLVESKGPEAPYFTAPMPSVLHVAGYPSLSRFDWGRIIADHFGYDPELIQPTTEIKGAAARPLRGGLVVKQANEIGVPIYSYAQGLSALSDWERLDGAST